MVRHLKKLVSVTQKRGRTVRTARTPENVNRVREAITRRPRKSAKWHGIGLGDKTYLKEEDPEE